ncbi:3-hydroxyacyl-CoA dehydrogenase NAD-binding domain-containing protein [Paenibacillus chondroitinus]|uniref:3-hydroxyacyl-CoA dehydrogenase NAD-binding domain-containing protein n=1 Tax=Paenibacillus chondroitinus TaxID=59842 RepID=A0ABU6DHR5_9BACL|nr:MULTISPECIES: 3-hydroxyacyl-CoA dehydrogenase NAD-binding domain-containing protein [Paenibacillus]MCY9657239.1 3-hydroxyacyl-CoA dehydrogenase NAD-binding domain-containing protein [Paenibacillus anseongense]MEB4797310.1 3-hydroxyacyl-CoA dehydrogenase NAD-binding domain-containing protein [Paenibacillus chondroitinus]
MVFKTIGVVGGGTMGQGISEMLAASGLEVLLVEKTVEKLDRALEQIQVSLDKQIERWALTEAEKKLILAKIKKADSLQDMAACDMVIETITEDLNAKKHVFFQLNQICDSSIILATNTSTLSVTEIAAITTHPQRVIGLHFLHPVAKVNLVEIIRAMKTSDEIFEQTRKFVDEFIHKKGIKVNESPGFITSRLICTLINEALHTLSEGVATAEDIDTAMRIGYDFKYGPLEMCDRFGLDAVHDALEGMFRDYGDIKYRPSFLLKKMVRAGHLGVKTGEGFFLYDKDGDRL